MDIYENNEVNLIGQEQPHQMPELTIEPTGEETVEPATQEGSEPAVEVAEEEAAAAHVRFVVDGEEEPPVLEEKPRKKRNVGKVLVAVAVAAALVAGSSAATFALCFSRMAAQEKRTEQLLSRLEQQIGELEEELNSKSFTGNGNSISGSSNTGEDGAMTPGQVYAKVVDSVVAITNEMVLTSGGSTATGTSYGSGFIISEDGYIVSNYHVVEGYTTLKVTTYDGTTYSAQLCGYDSTNDIAVLKIDAEGLPAVTIGSSDDLIVGDQVAVIGNPLGDLTATLTVGYVSAKDRVISTDGSLINMIQTDAAVNSGNSGGPIFNMNGEVVGIITAKYSGSTSSGATIEGIGFAIPIDDVTKKIEDLRLYGYVTGAYLGVLVQDMDQDVAEYYGLPIGVYVKSTTPGYCAEAAGVKSKDIIIGLGDYTITCMNDLTRALQNFAAGEITTITVWRSGLEIELEITLDEKPHN